MTTIRIATTGDVGPVLAFWRIAAEDAHRPVDTDVAVRNLLARDPEALLLAVADTQITGSVIAGWDGWRCHLYRLAVHPDCRGQGIARALTAAAEMRFLELGAGRADAMVLVENSPAVRAWEALGYRRQPEWARWIKPLRCDSR